MRGEQRAFIDLQRIGRFHRQAPAACVADLSKRGEEALVALDRQNAACADAEQRAGETARARADLQHVATFERASLTRDAAGQIEIEQEILAERFLG